MFTSHWAEIDTDELCIAADSGENVPTEIPRQTAKDHSDPLCLAYRVIWVGAVQYAGVLRAWRISVKTDPFYGKQYP